MSNETAKTPVTINIESLTIQFGNAYYGGYAKEPDKVELDGGKQDEAVTTESATAAAEAKPDENDDGLTDADRAFLKIALTQVLEELG